MRFRIPNASVRFSLVMSSHLENDNLEPEDDLLEELLSFGEDYQSQGFPNPDRQDCPGERVIRKALGSGKLLDESIREHLLVCSPCFNEFKKARTESNHKPQFKVMVASAGVIFVLILSLVAVFFLVNDESKGDSEIVKAIPNQDLGIARTADMPRTDVSTETPSSEPVLPLPKRTIETITFDSSANNIDRSGGGVGSRKSIPAERVNVTVSLAEGSPAGVYRINLLDEFGRSLYPEIKTTSDGVKVTASIDLSRLRGPARLCVGAGDEVPDCFSVFVD